MKSFIKSSIITSLLTIGCFFSAHALENQPTPYRLPAIHNASTYEVANNLIERAYESVRANSPFVEAEEASNDNERVNGVIDKMAKYAAKFLALATVAEHQVRKHSIAQDSLGTYSDNSA